MLRRCRYAPLLLALPGEALANGGTPLLLFGCCWLFFGNLAIGALEGWLVRRFAPEGSVHGNWRMVLANYVSAVAGLGFLALTEPLDQWATDDPLKRGLGTYFGLLLATFLVTIAVEGPFVAWQSGLPWRSRRTWILNLKVQSITYAGLLALTLAISPGVLNLPRAGQVDTVAGWVYFLDGNDVRRVRLDGSRVEHVMPYPAVEESRRWLSVERSADERARLVSGVTDPKVLAHLGSGGRAAPSEHFDKKGFRIFRGVGYFPPPAFPHSPPSGARTSRLPGEGLEVDGKRYSFETPYLNFAWTNATILPDRKIVAQYGRSVVLFDPETGTALRLATGESPGVLLDSTR